MTIPGGYIAGDVLTAANLNLLPAGKIARATITTAQTTITTVVDVTSATATWTAVSARLYRTSFFMFVGITLAADVDWAVEFDITDGSNVVKGTSWSPVTTAASRGVSGSIIETGLSGSVTRKLRAYQVNAANGSFDISASATNPCYFLVEDIGPA